MVALGAPDQARRAPADQGAPPRDPRPARDQLRHVLRRRRRTGAAAAQRQRDPSRPHGPLALRHRHRGPPRGDARQGRARGRPDARAALGDRQPCSRPRSSPRPRVGERPGGHAAHRRAGLDLRPRPSSALDPSDPYRLGFTLSDTWGPEVDAEAPSVDGAGAGIERHRPGIVTSTVGAAERPIATIASGSGTRRRAGADAAASTRPHARTAARSSRPAGRRAWPAARRAPPAARLVPLLGRAREQSRPTPRPPRPRCRRRVALIDQAGELRRLDRGSRSLPASASCSSTRRRCGSPTVAPRSVAFQRRVRDRRRSCKGLGTRQPRGRGSPDPDSARLRFDNQRQIENSYLLGLSSFSRHRHEKMLIRRLAPLSRSYELRDAQPRRRARPTSCSPSARCCACRALPLESAKRALERGGGRPLPELRVLCLHRVRDRCRSPTTPRCLISQEPLFCAPPGRLPLPPGGRHRAARRLVSPPSCSR